MSSDVQFTLEELEVLLERMKTDAEANVSRLEQATEAMRRGKVGAGILSHYGTLVDLAVGIREAALGTDQALEPNRALRDVRFTVPDAGDNRFLTGD
ncbi:hypothetical protein [Nocardiopsis sp. NPDC055824]